MFTYRMQPPHVITISVLQAVGGAHACFMAIVMPSEYVHLSYAATACDYHVFLSVVPLCSSMFSCCHPVSIPFLILCLFVIVPRTICRGLLVESILHHLAVRNASTEQQRPWPLPPQFPSTSVFNIASREDLRVPCCMPVWKAITAPRTATTQRLKMKNANIQSEGFEERDVLC